MCDLATQLFRSLYHGRSQRLELERRRAVSFAACAYFFDGSHASVSAIVAQLLAALEMNWSLPCGKPDSK